MSRPENASRVPVSEGLGWTAPSLYEGDLSHGRLTEVGAIDPERSAEISALSKSIIRITAGLDMHLRQKSKGKDFIIDAYAYRPKEREIDPQITPEEAIPDLWAHVRKIDQIGLDNLAPEWQVIRDSQRALAVFLEEKERLARGEPKTPYEEYLEAVSGYQLRLIPTNELDKNWENVIEILKGMGEEFNRESEGSVRAVIKRRSKDTLNTDPQEIERLFWRFDRRNRSQLAQILGPEIKNVRFDFRWEDTDAWWRFFEVMGIDGANYLRANWNEQHRDSYDDGWIEVYAGHEPVHFIFGSKIAREISEGRLDQAAGLLVIPGPVGFQMEGMAQTIGDVADYGITQDCELAVELYRMEKRALSNGLYLVEHGMSVDMAAIRIRKFMPRLTLDQIRKTLKEGTERPFERAFLPNYGMSDYAIMQLEERIGSVKAFFGYWFTRPLTPRQFLNPPLENLVNFEGSALD